MEEADIYFKFVSQNAKRVVLVLFMVLPSCIATEYKPCNVSYNNQNFDNAIDPTIKNGHLLFGYKGARTVIVLRKTDNVKFVCPP